MQREVKIGLGVVLVGAVVFAAVRFGAGPAAKSGLDLALANLPPGWAATHGAITYNALSGDARVDDLLITHDDQIVFSAASVLASGIAGVGPTSPPKRIGHITIKNAGGIYVHHIGSLEINGLEVENIRRLIDPAFYPNGRPASDARLPLLSSLDGTDLALHVDLPAMPVAPGVPPLTSSDVHVAEWHMDSLSARQFPAPPKADSFQDWAFLAALGRDFGYGSLSARDVTKIMPGYGRVRVGAEDVAGMQDGRIHSAQIENVTYTPESMDRPSAFSLNLDRAALRDMDLSRALDMLPAMMDDPHANASRFNNSIRIGGFEMGGGRLDAAHAPLITLSSVTGSATYQADGTQAGAVTVRGLKIMYTGRDTAPAVALALQRFGKSDFNMDVDEGGTYNPQDGRLKLTQADFTLHGLGALRFTADVDGLQNSGANPGDRLAMLRAVHLYTASLRWDDASLTDRIFHLLSLQSGKTETQLRAQLGIPVATLGFMMPEQPDAAAQINAFLDGRHRLSITLTPPHPPVSLGDVASASPTEKAALLGVVIKGD